jgi:sodium/potassium-transporting ATPase subunit alpha
MSNAIYQLRAVTGLCNSREFDAATSKLLLYKQKINRDVIDQAILRFSESFGLVLDL